MAGAVTVKKRGKNLDCKKQTGKEFCQFNNSCVHVISDLGRCSQIRVTPASSLIYMHSDNKQVADARIGDTVIDFEQVNPCAPSSFTESGNDKPVVLYAERDKIHQHGDSCAAFNLKFVPFVMDRFGAFGRHAFSFFSFLVNQVPRSSFFAPNWAASSPAAYWFQRLSVCQWNGNAAEVLFLRQRCINNMGGRLS